MTRFELNVLLFLTISLLSGRTAAAQDSSRFVQLKTGQKLYGAVIVSKDGRQLTLNGVRHSMESVSAYQNQDGYFARINTGGIFAHDKFVRREKTGRVWLYNDWQTYWYGDPNLRWSSQAYEPVYFSIGEAEPKRINVSNLKSSLSSNPASMRYLSQHETLTYVQIVLVVGGLAIIGSAFSGVDKEHPPSMGRLIGGGLVCNLAWIPHLIKGDLIMTAIEEYNRE